MDKEIMKEFAHRVVDVAFDLYEQYSLEKKTKKSGIVGQQEEQNKPTKNFVDVEVVNDKKGK